MMVHPYAPWYTDEIQMLRTAKRKAERKMNETGRPEHRKEFTEARNRPTNYIVKSKKGLYPRVSSILFPNPKSPLQCANELLNKTKKTTAIQYYSG